MKATASQRFSPEQTISRGELALFLYRAYNYTNKTLKDSEDLAPFIGTNTTLGKAFAKHEFMDEGIRQKMPIAAARQSVRNFHFSSHIENGEKCSQFMEEDFKLCYGNGFDDRQTGVTAVELFDDGSGTFKVNALQQQLGTSVFAYTSEKIGNVQWHYGKTTKAINGLYYYFQASAGEKAPYATVANSNITHLKVSTRPITN